MAAVIPVSAPPRVRTRLRNAPDGPVTVLHHGPDAVYLDVGGWCVGVVGSRATAVPCALRTSLVTLPAVAVAGVRSGVLHLDGVALTIGRLVDVSVPHLRATGPGGGLSADDVAGLVGRGDGLTPYGDDLLCGWIALHRAAGLETPEIDAAVRSLVSRTTMLSATLLDCALHGEVIPEFAAYVASLGTSRDRSSARAALTRVGHSSGRGLLAGARLALHRLGHEGTTAA